MRQLTGLGKVVLAAALVGAAVLAAGALLGDGADGDGASPGAASGQISPGGVPRDFVGLTSEDVLAGDEGYRQRTLESQRRIGVGLVRQTFDWSRIETSPGRYDLSFYDDYVADLASHRIEVMPILFNPPGFRSSRPSTGAERGTYPPRRPEHMGEFAAELVRRYGPGGSFWEKRSELPELPVRSWQVWNEPNVPVYWPSGPDAGEYAALLNAVSGAIKAEDPGAEVVTAGIPQSDLGVPFEAYLRALYAAGGGDSFDTLAVHAYARNADGVLNAAREARRLARQAGDDPPIWITEFGWATDGPSSPFTVDPEAQAGLIADTLTQLGARRRELGLRGFVYFNWRDSLPFEGGSDFFGLHTGLLDIEGRPKPGLDAFAKAVKELRG